MLTLDDELIDGINEDSKKPSITYKDIMADRGIFTGISMGYPITYNALIKKFIPGNNLQNKNSAFLGWILNYSDMAQTVDVLYRGFLLHDPLKIPMTLQTQHLQSYIYDKFKQACEAIIENMPRIRKLKRINLKMINREHALFIYRNIDSLIKQYEIMYDYEKAMYLKSQITTSPFYINDNGIIKVYNIQTNELIQPELETESYFLAYFTFQNK